MKLGTLAAVFHPAHKEDKEVKLADSSHTGVITRRRGPVTQATVSDLKQAGASDEMIAIAEELVEANASNDSAAPAD